MIVLGISPRRNKMPFVALHLHQLVHTMESKARTRARPALPDEICCMIASLLPWMPDRKRWQPWVLFRRVNRTFKQAIEQYDVYTWLPGSSIIVECEDDSSVWDVSRAASRYYFFGGFAGHSHRLAVYVSQYGQDQLEVGHRFSALSGWQS